MGDRAPNKTILDTAERIRRYDKLIQKQTGVAVKPLRFDGYVNLLNKYGTQKDTTENYQYESEPTVADEMLSNIYEGNGLFARIIDAPAEEAMKLGFELEGVKDTGLIEFYETALDDLDWEEICITAIKWARLFGGSIAVMLVDDGQGIEMPLDWKNIRSVDGIRVYDRSVIQPDYSSMFTYNPEDPFRTRGNTIGTPEHYYINSKYGSFKVHESRCLVFKNGVLPENCSNSIYEMWGMPEYIRIKRAMRDCELAHGNGPKMLERAIQAVYKVKNLSELLSTDAGEDVVIKRLQTIDLARGLLNSIAIDSEGEEYDFKTFTFTGVSEIIDTTCNQLSALTSIPQTILFGRSPAGMNSTGESDMENWYSFVARIQKRMLSRNLRYLLSIIFQAGIMTGEIDEIPPIKPKFKPLWSLSELEEAQLEQTRAATQQTRAATAQIYVGMQAIDPTEIRKGLSDNGEFNIETLLDDYSDEELFPPEEQIPDDSMLPSEATTSESGTIAEQGDFSKFVEQPSSDEDTLQQPDKTVENVPSQEDTHTDCVGNSVGVIVVSNGKILAGTRNSNTGKGELCGPGGHIERWETPKQAALRETEEEFGITPKELIPFGYGPYEPDTGLTPILYLCTEYTGISNCADLEIVNPKFLSLGEIEEQSSSLFKPFKDGIDKLLLLLDESYAFDGGSGSGNFGHKSVEGQTEGSVENNAVTREDCQHTNVDDTDWITVNGAHVPLDDDGTVSSGGQTSLRGKNFSNAKSNKSKNKIHNGNDYGLSTTEDINDSAAIVGKFDIGTTVTITKKNGKQFTFEKVGENEWMRDDQPDEEPYGDISVASNSWHSGVEVNEKVQEAKQSEETSKKQSEGSSKATAKDDPPQNKSASKVPKGPNGTVAASNVLDLVGEENLAEFDTGERPNKYSPNDSRWGTEPGEYTVYRSGDLSRNVVFTASEFEGSAQYANGFPNSETGDINPINSGVYSYSVHITKPFVAENMPDTYMKLFGTKPKLEPSLAQIKKGITTGDLWAKADEKIAIALKKKGYDAWLMTNPAPPAKKELNLIGASRSTMKATSRKVPDKVRSAWSDAVEKGGQESYAYKEGKRQSFTMKDWFKSPAYKEGKESGKWV